MEKVIYNSTLLQKKALFKRPDLLSYLAGRGTHSCVLEKRATILKGLERGVWDQVFNLFSDIGEIDSPGYQVDPDGRLVSNADLSSNSELESKLLNVIKLLIPWRKGPWKIGGENIDAEWNSNIKYQELAKLRHLFSGASILDIGGGNGYYAFRMRADGASHVICLDPSEKFFFQFEFFQKFAEDHCVQYEPMGYEFSGMLGHKFDIVSCMGVLYHQKNPLHMLECCRDALIPKTGHLILESMVIDSSKNECFFPPGRYAKARNVFFVPSVEAIKAMLKRTGFSDVQLISMRYISLEEQARSKYAPYESLADFLDPNDHMKTIEGYPAPARAILVARL